MNVLKICFDIIGKVVELSKVYDQPLSKKCLFKQIRDLVDNLEDALFPMNGGSDETS
jgi:hypothetical protein